MGYAMAIAILTVVASFILFGIPFIRFNSQARKDGKRA
jgi:hypothetical protein